MSARRQPPVLMEEQQALTAYLDGLLQEIAEEEKPPAAAPETQERVPQPIVRPVPAPTPPPPEKADHGPPPWAAERFQCLIFRVAGLPLAVPLVKLNGILKMPQQITPMPGHGPLFMGLAQHQGQQVKVVDIARLVLPADRLPEQRPSPGHLILIDEARWGLACDREEETLTLDPESVRWRTPQGRRPWLAGTVTRQLCAILDVDYLAQALASGRWD